MAITDCHSMPTDLPAPADPERVPPPPALPARRARVVVIVLLFLASAWLCDRTFVALVDYLGLSNNAGTTYAHFLLRGSNPLLRNLAFHWIPRAVCTWLIAWIALRAIAPESTSCLSVHVSRHHLASLAAGLLGILAWQSLRLTFRLGGVSWHPVHGADTGNFVLIYALRYIPSAFAEEITFRAFLLGGLSVAWSIPVAVLVSLTLFALAHAYGGPILALNSIVLGTIFTVAYLRTRSIGVTTVLHAVNNILYTCLTHGS
jgi:membrane protease YdiL (CAAX protease family)